MSTNGSFLGFQTVHFKVHDSKLDCKGGSRESTINRYPHHEGSKYGPPIHRGGMIPSHMRPHRGYEEEMPLPPVPQGPPPMNYAQSPPMPPPMPCPPPPPPGPPPPNPECDMKDLNKMFGMTASDIDKYSRVIFPVTFTCFQLMYWIIYQHLSDDEVPDLVQLHPD